MKNTHEKLISIVGHCQTQIMVGWLVYSIFVAVAGSLVVGSGLCGLEIGRVFVDAGFNIRRQSTFSRCESDQSSSTLVGNCSKSLCPTLLIRAPILNHRLQLQNNCPSQYVSSNRTHENAPMTAAADRRALNFLAFALTHQ